MHKSTWTTLRDLLITIALVAAATALGGFFHVMDLQQTNVAVAYILSVVLTARMTQGYLNGILASILSVLAFNWFFAEPLYTLKVNDANYWITFAIMAAAACLTSAVTTKFKQAAEEAREKEAESNALYQMTNHLTDAEDPDAIAGIMIQTVQELLHCSASCVPFDENGNPEIAFLQQHPDGRLIRREVQHPEQLRQRMEVLHAPYDIDGDCCNWPIYGRSSILGVLQLPKEIAVQLDDAKTRTLLAIIESSTLAMERFRSLREQARSREQMEQERYRGNLLRAISHDIRTPLSGIMGSCEMLMGMTEQQDPRYTIVHGVYEDADWLHSLVENILNLTRLQDGRLILEKQTEAMEEVIGSAIQLTEKRAPDREISVSMPDTLLMVPMDARLIHQVLMNLLDNAMAHSERGTPIAITVKEQNKTVSVSVADNGSGIPESNLEKVFQMFYTTRHSCPDTQRGMGLGLAICQSIIEAHGGTIKAENRQGGGAVFTFTLPMGGTNT